MESNPAILAAGDSTIGSAFLTEAHVTLAGALAKIDHCLDQLSETDLQWRQIESHNSIQNVILHLCGNLRQWMLHGVGGAPDTRNRPAEFADHAPRPKAELARLLCDTVSQCEQMLAGLPPEKLLERRRIQGFETTVLSAIFETVSHFVGHQHQIVYITRLRLGDAYKFQWTPASPEQGAPAKQEFRAE
jgi:hypothetical protein